MAFDVLNLIETKSNCDFGMNWEATIQSCVSCPADVDVTFSRENVEFEVLSGSTEVEREEIVLKNYENYTVAVLVRISIGEFYWICSELFFSQIIFYLITNY